MVTAWDFLEPPPGVDWAPIVEGWGPGSGYVTPPPSPPPIVPSIPQPVRTITPEPIRGMPVVMNGESPMLPDPIVQPAGLPALAGLGLAAILRISGRFLSIGFIKSLIQRFGAAAVKTAVGVAVFSQILELIGIGAGDDTMVDVGRRRKPKRYSIGVNPRLKTLLKVGKRVDNIFASYDKRISKFRSRLRGGYRRPRYVYAGAQYLSPVERKQLRRG